MFSSLDEKDKDIVVKAMVARGAIRMCGLNGRDLRRAVTLVGAHQQFGFAGLRRHPLERPEVPGHR